MLANCGAAGEMGRFQSLPLGEQADDPPPPPLPMGSMGTGEVAPHHCGSPSSDLNTLMSTGNLIHDGDEIKRDHEVSDVDNGGAGEQMQATSQSSPSWGLAGVAAATSRRDAWRAANVLAASSPSPGNAPLLSR